MGAHTFLYKATGGRLGQSVPGGPGKMLLLDHVGAKSGKHRTSPLLYIRDGEDLVIVASKGGYPKNPAWFYNLKANPDTEVQVGSSRLTVRAREADEAERKRFWPQLDRVWPGYADYRARSKGREIPLVVLEPR
jgi:deazaflavin-dependent oxidoreductase (nitroreductase family)